MDRELVDSNDKKARRKRTTLAKNMLGSKKNQLVKGLDG
jgi:hypothetical protein